MTTEKTNNIDGILSDLEELYWITLDDECSLVIWLNSVSEKVCEQFSNALFSTTEGMKDLNADYTKLAELMYEISVPYTDDDLSEHYANIRFKKLYSILKSVGFEGDEIY